MSKFIFSFVVVCLAASFVAGQGLGPLGTFFQNGVFVPGVNVTLASNGDVTSIQELFDNGIAIYSLNAQPFYLGFLSLPFNQLCAFGGELGRASCNVCSQDCVIAHNKYGGGCGPNPHPGKEGEQTCVCRDAPPANLTVPTVDQICGSLTGNLTAVNITQAAINDVLKIREYALQCNIVYSLPILGQVLNGGYSDTGCNTDCTTNHQYNNGTCGMAHTAPTTPSQNATSNPQSLYCNCSY